MAKNEENPQSAVADDAQESKQTVEASGVDEVVFDPKSVKNLSEARKALESVHGDLAKANARITEIESEAESAEKRNKSTITQLQNDNAAQADEINDLKEANATANAEIETLENAAKTAEEAGAKIAADAGVPPVDADNPDAEGSSTSSGEASAEQVYDAWAKLKKNGQHAEARKLFAANKAKLKSLI